MISYEHDTASECGRTKGSNPFWAEGRMVDLLHAASVSRNRLPPGMQPAWDQFFKSKNRVSKADYHRFYQHLFDSQAPASVPDQVID